jgi:hypothetical protein
MNKRNRLPFIIVAFLMLFSVGVLYSTIGNTRANSLQTCKVDSSSAKFEFKQKGEESTLLFTKGCKISDLKVQPNVDWLTLGALDESAGTLKLSVNANPSSQPRSAAINLTLKSNGSQGNSNSNSNTTSKVSVGVKQSGTEKKHSAVCQSSSHLLGTWFGPDRELESEAKKDAEDHNKNNKEHKAAVFSRP